jgi:adenylate cyclase
MPETRKLAAILAADVAGYSKLTGADEERTLARLRALRSDLIDPTIALHHGRVVKRTGDGVLIESEASSMPCAALLRCRMAWSSATPVCRPIVGSSFGSAFILATWSRRATAT